MSEESKKYTGFIYRTKTYVLNVVPFGLKVSTAALLCALNNVFSSDCDEFLIQFVNNFLIVSKSFNEHFIHLETVFKRLADANITINFEKSESFATKVKFLGHILTCDQNVTTFLQTTEKVDTI